MGLHDAVFVALPDGLRQSSIRGYLVGLYHGADALVLATGKTVTGAKQYKRSAYRSGDNIAAIRLCASTQRASAYALSRWGVCERSDELAFGISSVTRADS
jgi:hypothetical protein